MHPRGSDADNDIALPTLRRRRCGCDTIPRRERQGRAPRSERSDASKPIPDVVLAGENVSTVGRAHHEPRDIVVARLVHACKCVCQSGRRPSLKQEVGEDAGSK